MEENRSTSEHVLRLSGYYNCLNQVGVNLPDKIVIGRVTTKPPRSTRAHSTLEWYGNPVLEVMLLDHDEPIARAYADGMNVWQSSV